MSTSNIIVSVKYRTSNSVKGAIKKWSNYTVDPKKCDPTSIDKNDVLKDSIYYSDKELFLEEELESFAWNFNGDIDTKRDLKDKNHLERKGTIWNIMISFPSDFALNNGLVTKKDYYDLTKNVIPSFLLDAGFRLDNTLWYAVLHRNTKNPHIHLVLSEEKEIKKRNIISSSSVNKLKSLIGNYIIDNKDFYIFRDNEFKKIIGNVTCQDFTKIKSSRMFSSSYRRTLNKKLFSLYEHLPTKGRLQYNSKNIAPYKNEMDSVIEYILSHDSVKYKFEKYRIMLMKRQKELNSLYGKTKKNKENTYFNAQVQKVYIKIGNDILNNFKIYKSVDLINREKEFLKKHIHELNFKSRSDYSKQDKKVDIAKDLYKLCMLIDLNYSQTKKVLDRWIINSKYEFDSDILITSFKDLSSDMTSSEFYNSLKKLGYSYERYKKFKDKNFYKELNYKKIFNQAVGHVLYELEQEEKELVHNMDYDLNGY
jgi:hypothetical protein